MYPPEEYILSFKRSGVRAVIHFNPTPLTPPLTPNLSIYLSIYLYLDLSIYLSIYLYIHISRNTHTHIYTCIYTYICMYPPEEYIPSIKRSGVRAVVRLDPAP